MVKACFGITRWALLSLICSEAAAAVAQVVYNKHTKDTFQAAISRGNPNLVTPVELDFSLPRNVALAQQCQILLNWESSYKTLSRQASIKSFVACCKLTCLYMNSLSC